MRKFNIAIDGPSGVGKSSISRQIAQIYQMSYLNTGAMYRAFALHLLNHNFDLENDDFQKITTSFQLDFEQDKVLLNNEIVNDLIFTNQIASKASQISTDSRVRNLMVKLQREIAANLGYVLEGRDIGTVVLPSAKYKFYLDASPLIRARRRYLQDPSLDLLSLEQEIRLRDERDSQRENSPLIRAKDAIYINTDDYNIDQVVEIMKGVIDND